MPLKGMCTVEGGEGVALILVSGYLQIQGGLVMPVRGRIEKFCSFGGGGV